MATYQPGITDNFPNQPEFSPDYSFLSKALSTRQNQYDRGFEAMNSLNSSLLNSRIENSGNAEFRKGAFNKINGDLKSLSTMDLSRSENVQYAHDMFNPLLQDKEMMRDMQVTKAHDEAQQEYDSYASSPDADKRALASPVSQEYIQMGRAQMRDAKRGDGSILRVSPHEFVPFEDVHAYLDKAANADGLKIENSSSNGMYILKQTNGKLAVPAFSSWAANAMGTRFDKQFQVMADVRSEKMIRGVMETGLSRDQAITSLGDNEKKSTIDETLNEVANTQKEITSLTTADAALMKNYHNGIPKDKVSIQQAHDAYTTQLGLYGDYLSRLKTQTVTNINTPSQVFGLNIPSRLFEQAKKSTASAWGTNRAMDTASTDIKDDEYGLKKIENQYQIQRLNISAGIESRKMNQQAAIDDKRDFTKHQYDLETLRVEGKDKGSANTVTGINTPTERLYANDVTENLQKSSRSDVVSNTWESQTKDSSGKIINPGGIANAVFPNTAGHYNSLINKLNSHANGEAVKYTANDMALLEELNKNINSGNKSEIPQSKEMASMTLYGISLAMLHHYNDMQKRLPGGVSGPMSKDYYNKVAAIKGAMNENYAAFSDQQRVIGSALESGIIKSDQVSYAGTIDGKKTYSLKSELSTDQKKQMNILSSQTYQDQTSQSGDVVSKSNISGSQMREMLNGNNHTTMTVDGKSNVLSYQDLNPEALAELYGNNATMSFNPTTNSITATFKMDPRSKSFGKLSVNKKLSQQVVTVTMPYDKMQTIAPDMKGIIQKNTFAPHSLNMLEPFVHNPNANVSFPKEWNDAMGLRGSISRSIGGSGMTINYTYRNKNGKDVPGEESFAITNINRDTLRELEQKLTALHDRVANNQ